MRWLLLILLISVVGLLFAALSLARFIWQQRTRKGSKASQVTAKTSGKTEVTDVETNL